MISDRLRSGAYAITKDNTRSIQQVSASTLYDVSI
jgi:hypothetical protein